ncbi:hypothetical protein EC973_006886 [Apophysomyces ossiformis]|uniref:Transmembrane protein 135 N-terminal domain-containing protein n=1 Tax=Apophysomyces ossiformis TaxID=679940 RepID=A0A8H7BVN8_9FUNG|nr:hypothetical protein EC973_006886 [Apophysomyces ossiformis]
MQPKKKNLLSEWVAHSRLPPSLQPALITAIKAYGLTWTLTTAPVLLGLFVKTLTAKSPTSTKRVFLDCQRVVHQSLTQNGLPFLLAGALASHRFLSYLLNHLVARASHPSVEKNKIRVSQRSAIFLSAAVTMLSVKKVFPNTKTTDLTFFALVRALDVFAHRAYESNRVRQHVPHWILDYGSVGVFTIACTEIMFSWFYEPNRLPKSYANWITKMADMNPKLLELLRAVREKRWQYGKDTDLCDPLRGRIPCRAVHPGDTCETNGLRRFGKGFFKIFPLYFFIHLAPPLLLRPSQVAQAPLQNMVHVLKASVRSSAFLASFITIIWYSVCLVRTRIGHQVLGVRQSILDDTLAPFVGSALCGLSLLIETRHRRGEMALYVVPRALYSFTERVVGPHQRGRWWESLGAGVAETLVFALSAMVVLDAMYKDKTHIRSSVRGLLSWIMKDELQALKTEHTNGKTNGKSNGKINGKSNGMTNGKIDVK